MVIEQRIKDFEKLGFGMFVHFGLYRATIGRPYDTRKRCRNNPWERSEGELPQRGKRSHPGVLLV